MCLHVAEEVIMEKAARPLAPGPTHGDMVLRPKPDRRARPRVVFVSRDTVLTRLRAEYREMPGLRLTLAQAQRFCGVEPSLCRIVLDALVNEKFLSLRVDGQYAR